MTSGPTFEIKIMRVFRGRKHMDLLGILSHCKLKAGLSDLEKDLLWYRPYAIKFGMIHKFASHFCFALQNVVY